jgi:hypothetical protein
VFENIALQEYFGGVSATLVSEHVPCDRFGGTEGVFRLSLLRLRMAWVSQLDTEEPVALPKLVRQLLSTRKLLDAARF